MKRVIAKNGVSKNIGKLNSLSKFVMKRGEEILKWKGDNAVQKRFFSLEEREQNLLEKVYIVFSQECPELTWEGFLDHLRKNDSYDKATKAVLKKLIGDFKI